MIVLLNGPAGVGKDTLASLICDCAWFEPISFKSRIYQIARVMLGDMYNEFMDLYDNRETKEKPWSEIGGMSPRQFFIHISEACCKPVFGNEYFGQAVIEKIREIEDEYPDTDFVASDSGFPEEVFPILNETLDDIYVVRLYRDGYDFKGDSRRYLKPEDFEGQLRKPVFIDIHLEENNPIKAYEDIMNAIRNEI